MSLELMDKPAASPAVPAHLASDLSALETEVIDMFVQISRILALPKSNGEIYGLLFISPRPLSMDDLVLRLRLSKGSASQGLKFLRQIGAIKTVYVAADRRDHYEPEMKLRNLLVGFLKEKMSPHFEKGQMRLNRMEEYLAGMPRKERDQLASRVEILRRWEKTGRKLLPVLLKILGH